MSAIRIRVVVPTVTTPLPRFVAGSAALHGAALIAILLLPGLIGPKRSTLLPTLDAVLVAPIQQETTTPAAPRPVAPAPPPEKTPAPDGPSATPIEPPKPRDDPPPRPEPEDKPTPPVPDRTPPSQIPVGDPRDEPGEPAGESSSPIGSPGAGVALEGMGVEFDWYRDAVIRALFNAWRQPFAARAQDSFEVGVAFEILRDGSVRGIRIVNPSGDSRLDRSALRAVGEASLPPLPRNYGASAQPALFVFRLFPESDF